MYVRRSHLQALIPLNERLDNSAAGMARGMGPGMAPSMGPGMAAHALIAAILAGAIVGSAALDFCPVRCYCGETAVYCDDGRARHPPEGFWPRCETLTLSNNSISALDIHSLTGFPDLRDLSLAHNALTALDLQVFAAAPSLAHLALAHNPIDAILPPPKGEQLPNLRHLQLQDTLLSSIDTHLLQSVAPSLEALSIDDTPLACECLYQDLYLWATQRGVQLHHSCGGVSSCPFLPQQRCPSQCSCRGIDMDCADAGLHHAPVGLWAEYQRLHISGNRIRALYNYSLTGFPNLTRVDLANNRLDTLDLGAFAALPNLEYLSVRNNSVDSVVGPRDGVEFPNLQTLDLAGTNITSLDIDLMEKTMPRLTRLSIEDSPLACECGYRDLYRWALDRNVTLDANCKDENSCSFGFTSCPTGCRCESSNMYCSSAGLTEIPSGDFAGYGYITFQDNNITSLNSDSFSGFPDANVIQLSGNQLSVLDLDVFSSLPYLTHLYILNNNIESIVGSNGTQLKSLSVLYIAKNDFTSLDTELLDSALPSLLTISFQDTPLACNCLYESVYIWAQQAKVHVYATCNEKDNCSIIPCPAGCRCEGPNMYCQSSDLTEIPSGDWPGYDNLLFYSNNITSVSRGSFSGFPDARYLYLMHNLLTEFDLDVFAPMPYLSSLSVSYNNIDSFVVSNGTQLKSLETLSIDGTDFASLDTELLQSALPALRSLYCKETPLACCDYGSVSAWAQEEGINLYASCNAAVQCPAVLHTEVPISPLFHTEIYRVGIPPEHVILESIHFNIDENYIDIRPRS